MHAALCLAALVVAIAAYDNGVGELPPMVSSFVFGQFCSAFLPYLTDSLTGLEHVVVCGASVVIFSLTLAARMICVERSTTALRVSG